MCSICVGFEAECPGQVIIAALRKADDGRPGGTEVEQFKTNIFQ